MLSRNYKQTATYWPPGAKDGYGGVVYGTPRQIQVRWEDKAEKVVGPEGQDITSRSIVYVQEDLEYGFLYLGTSVASNPTTVAGAYPIRTLIKIPNLTRPDRADRRAVL